MKPGSIRYIHITDDKTNNEVSFAAPPPNLKTLTVVTINKFTEATMTVNAGKKPVEPRGVGWTYEGPCDPSSTRWIRRRLDTY